MTEFKMTFTDGSTEHLAHYGVKGMKWGIRKERVKAGLKRNFTRDKSQYNKQVVKPAAKKAAKSIAKGYAVVLGVGVGAAIGMDAAKKALRKSGNKNLREFAESETFNYGYITVLNVITGYGTANTIKSAWQYNKDVYGDVGPEHVKRFRNKSLKSLRR